MFMSLLGFFLSLSLLCLDDVFMPKGDAGNVRKLYNLTSVSPENSFLQTSDDGMDEIDRELEEFKRFCFMSKPLENRPKVAVKVNLKDLALKKT